MSPAPNRPDALRAALSQMGVDGFILPRGDEHLGEYVAPCAERLAWLTGFTGSAGLAAILPDRAAVFSDGRYITQMDQQVDGAAWERLHITRTPPAGWLAQHGAQQRIGYDPRLIAESALRPFNDAGLTLVPLAENPVDQIWTDRPAPPCTPCVPQPEAWAGQASATKREAIATSLRAAGEHALVLSDPASIAWLLNIRGTDVPYTPLSLSFAIVHDDGRVTLFIDPAKVTPQTRDWLGADVTLLPPAALEAGLRALAPARVQVDPARNAIWFMQVLEQAGATVIRKDDPCQLPKAIKNPTEQEGSRRAHLLDGVAICRFLHWLDENATRTTELAAAEQLNGFRNDCPDYREESFPAISGAGPNGAIIHYRVTPESNRALHANEVYLIDSGGQYPFGTTDITRTIWTGPGAPDADVRDAFTRVLRGHIALARARFPKGVTGHALDALARHALWEGGLNYDHGTGHGIGSYLSVHEGPATISPVFRPVALHAGMILSNEPGYYRPGAFGIRLENLHLIQPSRVGEANRSFLEFEVLTLAPFDRRLIDAPSLSAAETVWLDGYHARVFESIAPHLQTPARTWLAAACAPLHAG
ncbi:X-Pro aminopeptidase [Komagataeibacter nataicola]|uniref:X-Pro aminopeptidase n=1 Tax=Komagataeibacter nataicola TaxID=265960 RepID=A0A9N7CAE2_9PROT|nr:aminopeptidase P family protein [Komagataeibacter nataicola]AQU88333.1 X-Pro aminopeptidase [Komagataeibacter nataicola]PYD67609.1 X-Pro aminopeptidase [Komagataeibacter nataicola]WEQ54560.1 aminopeptidase family protein P [Komagataeibacter nataicola]GBR22816.1 Xaa-Pro aminopeptidase [Komagataeibacter nataicola NRIC 0616]